MVPEIVELVYTENGKKIDEGLVDVVDQNENYVWFRDDYAAVFRVQRQSIIKPRRFRNSN